MKRHSTVPKVDGVYEEMDEDTYQSEETTITTIVFTPDCQADWTDKTVPEIILKRINAVNLKMEGLEIYRNNRNAFTSCKVRISPTSSAKCNEIVFPFNGKWTWKFG